MDATLTHDWKTILISEFSKPYFIKLQRELSERYRTSEVFPPQTLLFNALNLCPFDTVSVVILGQDPYHGPGQAHGLSFSVPHSTKIPPSLKNIYKEISTDVNKTTPDNGNLERWATQGVLLLNTTLTVESGKPGSHQKLGWEIFTDEIIKKISNDKEHVVFLLWGNFARSKKQLIDSNKHLILEAPHPSPLSAHSGFFGCKHFSQTNSYLTANGLSKINW